MKSIAQILKYEGLLLTGLTLLVLFMATDMFLRFWYLLLLGPLSLVIGFAMDVGSVGATLRRRTAKYGFNAVIFTLVFIAIVVFVNVIVKGYAKTWDGTSAKVNTLSEQTVKILQSLKAPVTVSAFFNPAEAKDVEHLLKRYKDAAPPDLFSYQIIDPDLHPEALQKYDVNRRGAIVVEQNERKNIIVERTEQGLTQSILKVTQSKTGPLCFVSGHGEAGLEDAEENGASLFKRLLENENNDVKGVVLAGRAVPEDCSALVIAGPDRAFSEVETQTVGNWVEKGGSLLLLEDANVTTGFEPWLATLGVKFDDDVIVEPYNNPFFGSQLGVTPVVQEYPPHEITKDIRQPTIFNMARSLSINPETDAKAYVSPLLKTTEESWGETKIKELVENQAVEKDAADLKGPLTLGAVAELKPAAPPADTPAADGKVETPPPAPKAGRVVIVGDSSFLRNSMITQLYNNNLALNMVAWLSGKEEIISVRPNEFASSMVFLTNEDRAQVFIVSVLGIPILVSMFGIGLIISRNRRSEA